MAINQQRARGSQLAGPDVVSHSTWVLVRDEIPCVPKGEICVKGIRNPVLVYEVSSPS